MPLHIRPFAGDEHDYAAMAAVRNAAYPEYPRTADELREQDGKRDPRCFALRLVAEHDGTIIGVGNCGNMSWMFHPQKFELGVYVHPDLRRRGVGGQLYDHLMAEIAPREPISLRHGVREDDQESLGWAAGRGFVESHRAWESRLDVAAFDPGRFAGHVERVMAGGVAIFTAAELEARDADFWRRYHELDVACIADEPSPEPQTPASFEQWRKYFTGPNFLPDAHFLAVVDGQYAGLSSLWRRESTPNLDTGFTAVRREYRRRGIALALKLRAIDYAKRVGAPIIITDNESTNRGMLSINEALGFARQPTWIFLVNRLRSE
ncbi:GNAT family N-acetyltransferase [Oscillochloris sp. ZM17-4]|uniref:GNAT family N-acetyltransferase n=1 Tax=Oscillochloris sp. ZM17-4 TaxID=2866714 RepID=UPI001C7348B3|nr:GNAT family N-acetyltransferase [Oscillochloris sp. ZM17-4]MBX0327419.1 GNAT family N-acetyltransferase [Oscillochloris sp. ZM17-4]